MSRFCSDLETFVGSFALDTPNKALRITALNRPLEDRRLQLTFPSLDSSEECPSQLARRSAAPSPDTILSQHLQSDPRALCVFVIRSRTSGPSSVGLVLEIAPIGKQQSFGPTEANSNSLGYASSRNCSQGQMPCCATCSLLDSPAYAQYRAANNGQACISMFSLRYLATDLGFSARLIYGRVCRNPMIACCY